MTADIEAVLVAALGPILGVPVATEGPVDNRVAHVRVTATGGPPAVDLVIDSATVGWEAWGLDYPSAAALAGRVRDAITSLAGASIGGVFVLDAKCGRGARFPDASGVPRYVGSATIIIHDR